MHYIEKEDQKITIVGKCRTGKYRTKFGVKSEGGKMQDQKMQEHNVVRVWGCFGAPCRFSVAASAGVFKNYESWLAV